MRVFRDAGLALLLFVVPAFSQSADAPQQPSQPSETQQPSAKPAESSTPETANPQTPNETMAHRRRHQVPCWRVAKISPELVNQRWKLEDQGKVQIAAVCADPKTTAEQKQQKIHAVHKQTDEEVAKIIPADQLKVFNACQAERDKENPKPKPLPGEKEFGPCGGTIPKNTESGMSGMQHNH
jgi:hypothetical protein